MARLVLLSIAVLATTTIVAASLTITATTDAPAADAAFAHIKPEIVNELRGFLQLIPAATVDELVAKHYIVDGNFRKAVKYLRGAEFTQLLQNVQRIPEIIEILDFLQLNNVATAEGAAAHHQQQHHHQSNSNNNNRLLSLLDGSECRRRGMKPCELAQWQLQLASITERLALQIELLPAGYAATNADDDEVVGGAASTANALGATYAVGDAFGNIAVAGAAVDDVAVHSFSSFVEELMQHLPRDHYVQMINEKRQRSAAFAAFYAALRDEQFGALVAVAMKSSNLTKTLQTLSSQNIDVKSLQLIIFRVISWGPSV